MKKVTAFLLCIALLFSSVLLWGCSNNAKVPLDVNFEGVNYNNQNNNSFCNLYCGSGDTAVYSSTALGYDSTIVYLARESKKYPLLVRSQLGDEIWMNEFRVVGKYGYFSTTYDTKDSIYRYDFQKRSYEKIMEDNYIYSWMATDDFVVYGTYNEGSDRWGSGYDKLLLSFCDGNEPETVMEGECASYCIVDGKLRYLIPLGNQYLLYEYDAEKDVSNRLGEFKIRNDSEYVSYNFTSDKVVIYGYEMGWFEVYNIESGESKTYSCPLIDYLTAYDKYAYAVGMEVGGENVSLYRISLETGEYEELCVEDSEGEPLLSGYDCAIFVSSDDEVFFEEGTSGFRDTDIYKYDAKTNNVKRIN